MPPKFGTSGLRGLVVELTSDLVADHVRAFVASCPVGTGLMRVPFWGRLAVIGWIRQDHRLR